MIGIFRHGRLEHNSRRCRRRATGSGIAGTSVPTSRRHFSDLESTRNPVERLARTLRGAVQSLVVFAERLER